MRGERAATTDEDRSAVIAVTRAAALLLLELLGRAAHLRTRFLRFGTRAARVAIRNDDLMHEAFGEFTAEHFVGDRQRFLTAYDLQFHDVPLNPSMPGG